MARKQKRKFFRAFGSIAEQMLAQDLGALGVCFIAQHGFILKCGEKHKTIYVDFFLPYLGVVVEVDGKQHLKAGQAGIDQWRDKELLDQRKCNTILRFNCQQIYSREAIDELKDRYKW